MRKENVERLKNLNISKNDKDFIVMSFLIRDIKMAISNYAKGNTLDVGCGNKPYERFFDNCSEQYIGCDVVQSSQKKVDILCLATDLKIQSENYDTVFSTQVMEHVNDSDKMLSECNRVLKSNGHLILSVPFCWELHEEPYDFFRFTKYGLKEICTRNNFEIVEIIPNGGKWAAIMQMNINIIYSSFKSKHIIAKGLKVLFIHLHFTSVLNKLGLWLDKKFYDPLLTLNYVLIAKKINPN